MAKGLDHGSVTNIDSIWYVHSDQNGVESPPEVNEIEETSNPEESTKENGIFLAYFNLFYFLGLVPFKVHFDSLNNVHLLKVNCFQKTFCAIAYIVVILVQTYIMYTASAALFRGSEISIVALLEFCSQIASVILTFYTMRFHWWKQKQFLQLVEHTTIFTKPKTNLRLKILVVTCVMTYIGQSLIVTWYMYNDPNHYGNTYGIHKETNLTNSSIPPFLDTSPGSPVNIFLYFIFAYCFLYYMLSQGVILVLAISLRRLGAQFQTHIMDGICTVSKGMRLYRKLKESTDFIHRVYGNMLLQFYVASVSYFAEAPYILMGKRGDAEKTFFVFFVISGIVWLLAAEFHYTVQSDTLMWTRSYLNKDESSVPLNDRLRLLDISQEVAADPVALSCKYFSVTYHHISSMLKTIVTYGIIVFQIHEGQTS